jgi:hypothetical protein
MLAFYHEGEENLCVVFYSLGKGLTTCSGRFLGRDRSLIYRWMHEAGLIETTG